MRIVYRWKANVSDYIDIPEVIYVCTNGWKKEDHILAGRDGWVAYLEESPDGK